MVTGERQGYLCPEHTVNPVIFANTRNEETALHIPARSAVSHNPLKYPFFIPRLCMPFPFSFQDIIHKILLLCLLLQKVFQLFPVSSGYPCLSVIIIKIDDLPELFRIGKPVIQLHAVLIGKASFRFIGCKNIQAKADRPAVFLQKLPEKQIQIPDRVIQHVFFKIDYGKIALGK